MIPEAENQWRRQYNGQKNRKLEAQVSLYRSPDINKSTSVAKIYNLCLLYWALYLLVVNPLWLKEIIKIGTVKPVLRGHLWGKKGSIHMKFSDRTRKGWPFSTGDCLIEVTLFSFGHCAVCSSSIYGFRLPLQTLLVTNPVVSHEWGKDREGK
jgi:hypothetical protein